MKTPKIRQAHPSSEPDTYTLLLEFDNGEERMFDLKPHLSSEVFAPLRTRELFEQVRVVRGSLEWPGERDLAYDMLYHVSKPVGRAEAH